MIAAPRPIFFVMPFRRKPETCAYNPLIAGSRVFASLLQGAKQLLELGFVNNFSRRVVNDAIAATSKHAAARGLGRRHPPAPGSEII